MCNVRQYYGMLCRVVWWYVLLWCVALGNSSEDTKSIAAALGNMVGQGKFTFPMDYKTPQDLMHSVKRQVRGAHGTT